MSFLRFIQFAFTQEIIDACGITVAALYVISPFVIGLSVSLSLSYLYQLVYIKSTQMAKLSLTFIVTQSQEN